MCGILGYVSKDARALPVDRLARLTNLLRHRGPDAGSYWSEGPVFLGHRRLSIIDLDGGAQPMASACGRFVVVFNGEIYNFLEVREELACEGLRFRTESDTEVILAGYETWGIDVSSRLVGMFAFAIWDRREESLYLARDRMGEKPLFVHDSGRGLIFASELLPIAQAMTDARRIDRKALAGYLCLNYVPGDRTMLDGVRRVAPGTWQLYRPNGTRRSGRYWDVPANRSWRETTFAEDLDELQKRIDRAITITLRSDVPVGLFLSGGIDSSVVAESASRQGDLKRAYCLTMEDEAFSEWSAASYVAETLGLEIRRVEMFPSVLEDFLEIVGHADDPLADSSALAVWTISKAAADDVKVVISGDGGDELFAGYLTHAASRLHRRWISPLPMMLRRLLRRAAHALPIDDEAKVSFSYKLHRFLRGAAMPTNAAHFTWNGTWLPEDAATLAADARLRELTREALRDLADAHDLSPHPSLPELQIVDLREYLPNDILTKVDRMSMAHGLEIRSPLLNPEIVEFALALHPKRRMSTRTKLLLRELCRRHFGSEIADAPKQGFSIPIHAWLRGPGRPLVNALLSGDSVRALEGLLDGDAVTAAVRSHMRGDRPLGWELWGLMVLSAWHSNVVRKTLADTELPRAVDPEPLELPSLAAT